MANLEMNGSSFEFSQRGEGEPLVLVHGSVSDSRTWAVQLEAFGRHFHTIAYSRRYHWPNAEIPQNADYSMLEHVDDLKTLLESLEMAPAHLVGHSYGAFVCLLLAIREPAMVRSLVLAEPPVVSLFASIPPKPIELLRLLLTKPRTAATIMKFGATGILPAIRAAERGDMQAAVGIFGPAVLGRKTFRQLSDSRLEQIHVNAIRAEFVGSGFAPLRAGEVRSMQAPTLLITARHSPRLFHRLADGLHALLPHAERLEIPGASHILHEDNPEAFNTGVLRFVAGHELAS